MLNRNTYEIDTTHLNSTNVPDDLSRQMRASYYFLGALLSRFGKAQVAMPGGCNLGPALSTSTSRCSAHWVQRTAWTTA